MKSSCPTAYSEAVPWLEAFDQVMDAARSFASQDSGPAWLWYTARSLTDRLAGSLRLSSLRL